jgi:hypothetical protein
MNRSTRVTLRKNLFVAAGLAMCAALLAVPAAADEFTYVGSANCKMCHNKEVSGKQFTIWEASPHAKAFETLASEQSKTIAKGMGIDDPQTADACLRCHVTAHGVAAERIGPRFKLEEGVGCESCHGPASGYNKLNVKKQVMTGEVTGASIGLWEINEALCVACHNEESPTFKGFDFAEAMKAIAHPYPDGFVEATYKK